MKKILSFILAVVLLFSVMPVTLSQAVEYISEINLEIPNAVEGYSPYDLAGRCIESNVGYVYTIWAYDLENPDEKISGGFVAGKTYLLEMFVEAWGTFLPGMTVSVNGKNIEYERWGKREVRIEYTFTVEKAKEVAPGKITIAFPEDVGNTNVSSVGKSINVDYEFYSWYCWVSEYGSEEVVDDFVTGKKYVYRIFLIPKYGEAFPFDKNAIDITINGKRVTADMISYNEDEFGGIIVEYIFEAKYNTLKYIDRVDIKLNYPEKGDNIEDFKNSPEKFVPMTKGVCTEVYSISNDKNYLYILTEENFLLLEDYYLYLFLYTEYDYRFTDDVKIYCNGEEIGNRYGYYNDDKNITLSVPLQDEGSHDITSQTSKLKITVPDVAGGLTGLNYIKGIEATGWLQWVYIFDENGAKVKMSEKLQTDKKYTVKMLIDAYGVFVLPSVSINGKSCKDFELLDRNTIYCEYTFKAKKADVKEHNNINITLNENIGNIKYDKFYNIINVDLWNSDSSYFIREADSDCWIQDVSYIFETGKEYVLHAEFYPHYSYTFPENIENLNIFINGNKLPADSLSYKDDNLIVEYTFVANPAAFTDRVDIVAENPHKGQYISYYERDAAEWLNIEANVNFWGVSNSADTDFTETRHKKFKANKNYYMHIYFSTDADIILADVVDVYVNGEYKTKAYTDEFGYLKIAYKLDVEKASFVTNIKDFFQWFFWYVF